MAIYGTALLSACLLAGVVLGKLIGQSMGLDANVGGVGIAMLLLILATDWLRKRGALETPTERGILFWSSIYIPIVVAMAASQNVVKAIRGGWLAVTAGVLAVLVCFALVPLVNRLGPVESGGVRDTNQQTEE